MPSPHATAQAKRELRLRIARQRRRIDRRWRSLRQEGRQLLAWQTYLGRISGLMLTAVGTGVSEVASLPWQRWGRAGFRFFRRVVGIVLRRLFAWLRPRSAEVATASSVEAPGSAPAGGGDGA